MKIATSCPCCAGTDLRASPAVLMPFVAERVFGWTPVEIGANWDLRDLAPGHAYSLCNTLGCDGCGLLFLDMRFDGEEMAALYRDYRGPAYREARVRHEPGYGTRNDLLNEGSPYIPDVERFLEPHLPPAPRVLDWGGDTGLNTPFRGGCAAHHVFDISGKPPVQGAIAVGPAEIAATEYDLIVSSNVLEHVPHPAAVVAEMAAAMGPDTILYIEVPHEDLVRRIPDAAERRGRKRHWHEHVNFYTEAAIEALLGRAGLASLDLRSMPVVAGGVAGHVFAVAARRAEAPQAVGTLRAEPSPG